MIGKVRRLSSMALVLAMLVSLLWSHPAWAQSDGIPRLDPDRVISELGILLLHVEEGSPAALAGLESGDVVLAVNGLPVEKVIPFLRLMASIDPGDLLTLVVRSGDEVEVRHLTAGSRGHGRAYFGVLPVPIFGQNTTVGELASARVLDTPALQPDSPLCMQSEIAGLNVLSVARGGPADLAGIAPGDTITSVNGSSENVEGDLVALLETASVGDTVAIGILAPDTEGGFGFTERVVSLTLGQHPNEDRPYYGLRIAPAMLSVVTDCIVESEQGRVVVPEEEAPAALPTALPPAGMENCIYSQTWGFGVTEVLPGSPADVAGLAANDAIVRIDGVEIPEAVQAESLLAGYAPGDEVTLHIISPARPGSASANGGEYEVTVELGIHPQDPTRAFLGIMGMPVVMGDSVTCSGSAEAEPVPEENPMPAAENGKGSNVPKTQTQPIAPTPEISDTVIITSAMITAPETASDTGLWLWCSLEEGIFHCRYPANLGAPIILEPADSLVLPIAPEGISGGAILPGTEISPTEVITPVEVAPIEVVPIDTFPLPEQPLIYCWTGEGFELCPSMAPMGPIAPGPSTDPGSK